MSIESLLFVAIVGSVVFTTHRMLQEHARPIGLRWISVLWLVFPFLTILVAFNYRQPEAGPPPAHDPPVEVSTSGYVGSHTCLSCHPHEHDTWQSSWHPTMTQKAHPSTTMPEIDSVRLEHGGTRFEIDRDGDELRASFGPIDPLASKPAVKDRWSDGGWVSRPIVLTTGSHHMQMYWMSFSDSDRRMAMFPFAYLGEQERFVPRDSLFLQPPANDLSMENRWGSTCIFCHTTFGRFAPDSVGELNPFTAKTQAAEFGIACEACHGPGETHVAENRNPLNRYRQHLEGSVDPNIVNPRKLDHERSSQVCGQCHGIQLDYDGALAELLREGVDFRPGDNLHESKRFRILRCCSDTKLDLPTGDDPQQSAELLLASYFWSDGMVRVSGREFNGLLESPCYQHGDMSCLSCHVLHQPVDDPRPAKDWANDQLKFDMQTGNTACVQCHESFANEEVLAAHTHHDINSSGSSCYNCHMSYTTYGLVKAIRSHQISSPDVAVSLATGRPNACNQCHLDQTLAWTSDHLQNWYGLDRPELSEDQESISASVLSLLSGDAGQRALMAWSFGWKDAQEVSGTSWMAPYLAQLLVDPYPAVRLIAHRSLKSIQDFDALPYDYVADEQHRENARHAILEHWQQQSEPSGSARPGVLVNESGEIIWELFAQLLSERDNRVVNLRE